VFVRVRASVLRLIHVGEYTATMTFSSPASPNSSVISTLRIALVVSHLTVRHKIREK
jgi:hypothetical protein